MHSISSILSKCIKHLAMFAAMYTCSALTAQSNESLIQFSGTVLTVGRDSLIPVPYASVRNLSRKSGGYTSMEGNFSIVAARGDVIEYQSVGFSRRTIKVPENIESNKFYTTTILIRDTMLLPEAIIVPWKDVDDLKKAFLDLKLNEDDIARAYQNLNNQKLAELHKSTPYDGQALGIQTLNYQNLQNRYSQGVLPIQRIFDPWSWAEFINQLKKGKSSK